MTCSLITTGFHATSTADDVVAGRRLGDLRAVVTGASSGLGVETARALAQAGADVTLAVRDVSLGERVAERITASTGNDRVRVAHLDLADQGTVAAFAGAWSGPLHLLVNNAGTVPSALFRTEEGWEWQFAVNHLGHFALSLGLRRALAAGSVTVGKHVSSR